MGYRRREKKKRKEEEESCGTARIEGDFYCSTICVKIYIIKSRERWTILFAFAASGACFFHMETHSGLVDTWTIPNPWLGSNDSCGSIRSSSTTVDRTWNVCPNMVAIRFFVVGPLADTTHMFDNLSLSSASWWSVQRAINMGKHYSSKTPLYPFGSPHAQWFCCIYTHLI